jgi:hypothetical protein
LDGSGILLSQASCAYSTYTPPHHIHTYKKYIQYSNNEEEVTWRSIITAMTIFSKCCVTLTTIAAFSALSSQNFFRQSTGRSRILSSFFHTSTFASAMALPNTKQLSFLDASSAKDIDVKLMKSPGFSLDQLMELAGWYIRISQHHYNFVRRLECGYCNQKVLRRKSPK